MTVETDTPLVAAIRSGDLAAIEQLAKAGADLNQWDRLGDPPLHTAVDEIIFADESRSRDSAKEVIVLLVNLGADINRTSDDGSSIFMVPIFNIDLEAITLLLELGADPNQGRGFSSDTVYDTADSDYEYEAWIDPKFDGNAYTRREALIAPEDLRNDEDARLAWLVKETESRGYPKPEIQVILRQHGALTNREITKRLGGRPDQFACWTDTGWALEQR